MQTARGKKATPCCCCGLEGIAGGDRAVLDMALLAGMNSDDVEAGVSAASPGSSKAVRGFETSVIIWEEKPCLSVRLDAGRNQGVVEDVV